MMESPQGYFEDEEVAARFEADLEKQGVVVEPAREFPEFDIDCEVFGLNAVEVRNGIDVLERWLRLPYITDGFGEAPAAHDARRRRRAEMLKKYGDDVSDGKTMYEVFHENKFSANGLMAPGYVALIANILKSDPQCVDVVRRLPVAEINMLVKTYPVQAPIEQRRAKIMAMEDAVVEALKVLEEFSKDSQR